MAREYKKKKDEKVLVLDSAHNIPPQALDIESGILGAMLTDNRVIDKVSELIKPDMFYSSVNRKIFTSIRSLYDKGNPVDLMTLLEELRKNGEVDDIGGVGYLTELRTSVASAANIEYHCKIIIEKYMLREMIGASLDVARRCFESQEDTFELLDAAEKRIFEISENKFKKTFLSIDTLVTQTLGKIDKAKKGGTGTGLPTGYDDFDRLTGGLQKSDLIIVAARPGMGKTAFGLSIARNMAEKYPVGFFSLEMTGEQIVMRLLSSEARVNSHNLRMGWLKQEDQRKIPIASRKLSNLKIFIDDTSALSILELRAKARRLIREHNVSIIFVDYLQLMQGPQNLEREREISFISKALKSLAKELEIPIVALAQLNRQVETRPGKKIPLLSDLRESGSIEQDADMVCFIHRPSKYQDSDRNEIPEEEQKIAQIIIAKQRNGPTDTFKLVFNEEYTRFENMADFRAVQMLTESMEEPGF